MGRYRFQQRQRWSQRRQTAKGLADMVSLDVEDHGLRWPESYFVLRIWGGRCHYSETYPVDLAMKMESDAFMFTDAKAERI